MTQVGIIEDGFFKGRKVLIDKTDDKTYWVQTHGDNFVRCCLVHDKENIPEEGCDLCH